MKIYKKCPRTVQGCVKSIDPDVCKVCRPRNRCTHFVKESLWSNYQDLGVAHEDNESESTVCGNYKSRGR